jgi:hypothetical protein
VSTMSVLAAIAFDPNIRGLLVVATGVVVLVGSIYLLVATNIGVRNGFLVVAAALTGWCFTMVMVWWMDGIGFKGRDPAWLEKEVNFSRDSAVITDVVAKLPRSEDQPDPAKLYEDYVAKHPDVKKKVEAAEGAGYTPETLTKVATLVPELKAQLDGNLNGWRILPESDARRGDASAAADATMLATEAFGQQTAGSYTIKDVYFYGGKSASEPETIPGERNIFQRAWHRVETVFQPKNPTLYAAVTLQKNVEQVVAPGEAPPPAQIDENAQTVTVVLQRDLGNKRLIPFFFALFNGVLFAVFAWMLHTRDKVAMRTRAEWKPGKPAKAG